MALVFSLLSVGTLWVCSYWERFLLEGLFWIREIFPLIIHSGMLVSWKHLFISIASLPWIELNFLNQYLCMPSWLGVFRFSLLAWYIFRCQIPSLYHNYISSLPVLGMFEVLIWVCNYYSWFIIFFIENYLFSRYRRGRKRCSSPECYGEMDMQKHIRE